MHRIFCCCFALALAAGVSAFAQTAAPIYDLLLRGGHVLDDKNHVDGLMDVAIKDGKIARVAAHIPSSAALKTVDVKGLYVTPGLIDIHVHVYAGTGSAAPMRATTASLPMDLLSALASRRWWTRAAPAGGTSRTSRIALSIARRRAYSPC